MGTAASSSSSGGTTAVAAARRMAAHEDSASERDFVSGMFATSEAWTRLTDRVRRLRAKRSAKPTPVLSAREAEALPKAWADLIQYATTTDARSGLQAMDQRLNKHIALAHVHRAAQPRVRPRKDMVDHFSLTLTPLDVEHVVALGSVACADPMLRPMMHLDRLTPGTSILYNGAFGLPGIVHYGVYLGHFRRDMPMPRDWVQAVAARAGDANALRACSEGQWYEFATLNSRGRVTFPHKTKREEGKREEDHGVFAADGGVDLVAQVTVGGGGDSGSLPTVAVVSLANFCASAADQKSGIYTCHFAAPWVAHMDPLRTLYRTLCAVGRITYHLKNFNCEHVATWLVTGYLQSAQSTALVRTQDAVLPRDAVSRLRRVAGLVPLFVRVARSQQAKLAAADAAEAAAPRVFALETDDHLPV